MSKYHDILEVSENASPEEIKKAYRKKAKEFHPDHGGDENKFKEIQEAYAILTGKQQEKNIPNQEGFTSGFPPGFDEFVRQHMGGFGFGGFSGGFSQKQQRPPSNDKDIVVTVEVNIQDIKNGKDFQIQYHKAVNCKDCNGVGAKSKNKCDVCNGRGMVSRTTKQGNSIFTQSAPCPKCRGQGEQLVDPCKTCNSNGYTMTTENLYFEVKKK